MSGTTTPGAQRPLRQDAARNRERLVLAARDAFHRSGIDAPLEEIARRAGVSIGTLYNRFSSRGELVDAALGPVVQQSVEIAERAMRTDEPWNGFVAFMEETCELLAAERGYTDVYRAWLSDTPVIDAARERLGVLKARIMARAKAAGDLRNDVETTDIVLAFWAIAAIAESTREAAPDAWRRHLALILDGLSTGAAHPLPAPALTSGQFRNATPPPRPDSGEEGSPDTNDHLPGPTGIDQGLSQPAPRPPSRAGHGRETITTKPGTPQSTGSSLT